MKGIPTFSIFHLPAVIWPVRKKVGFQFSILLFALVISSCRDIASERKQTPVTFAEHISPIIFKNCTPCHREGEAGPFTLINYSDARRNANKIKFVTQTRYMPPWPADVNYSHFVNERV